LFSRQLESFKKRKILDERPGSKEDRRGKRDAVLCIPGILGAKKKTEQRV